MNITRVFRALAPVDAANVQRDPLLRWLVIAPLLISLLIRLAIPVLRQLLLVRLAFDLQPYDDLLAGLLIQLTPMMAGMVLGFMLLDQRDDRTLTALRVTPLSLGNYLFYRAAAPAVLALFTSLLVLPLSGLTGLRPAALLGSSLGAALLAPFFMLLYAVLAKNKVQGFAVMKASGIFLLPPLAAWFASGPWGWLAGFFPTFWPVKVFWLLQAGDRNGWWVLLAGLAVQMACLFVLLKIYERMETRE